MTFETEPRPRSGEEPGENASARSAALLGSLARGIDGSVDPGDERAARDRFLLALGSDAPRSAPRMAALAGALALAAAAVLLWLSRGDEPLEYRVSGPVVARGEWLDVAHAGGPVALRFSEGTEIDLGPGSKGKVEEVTSDGARVVLAEGALHARVVHREKASWVVEAGPYAIRVTGTAFDVGWSARGERLELTLHDGSVVVQGPSWNEGIRVAAGQRLVADARSGGAQVSSLFEKSPEQRRAEETEEPAGARATPEPAAATPARPAATWAQLVANGDFQGVLDSARARGLDRSVDGSTLRDLVALSDAARYSGDRALAKRGLLAQRSRFAASPEARTAAFVLGRMADDAGAAPEALQWYETYLQEAPAGAFASAALGRKLVVLVRSGRTSAAHETAAQYLKRYPRGAHAGYAQEVLQGS